MPGLSKYWKKFGKTKEREEDRGKDGRYENKEIKNHVRMKEKMFPYSSLNFIGGKKSLKYCRTGGKWPKYKIYTIKRK